MVGRERRIDMQEVRASSAKTVESGCWEVGPLSCEKSSTLLFFGEAPRSCLSTHPIREFHSQFYSFYLKTKDLRDLERWLSG